MKFSWIIIKIIFTLVLSSSIVSILDSDNRIYFLNTLDELKLGCHQLWTHLKPKITLGVFNIPMSIILQKDQIWAQKSYSNKVTIEDALGLCTFKNTFFLFEFGDNNRYLMTNYKISKTVIINSSMSSSLDFSSASSSLSTNIASTFMTTDSSIEVFQIGKPEKFKDLNLYFNGILLLCHDIRAIVLLLELYPTGKYGIINPKNIYSMPKCTISIKIGSVPRQIIESLLYKILKEYGSNLMSILLEGNEINWQFNEFVELGNLKLIIASLDEKEKERIKNQEQIKGKHETGINPSNHISIVGYKKHKKYKCTLKWNDKITGTQEMTLIDLKHYQKIIKPILMSQKEISSIVLSSEPHNQAFSLFNLRKNQALFNLNDQFQSINRIIEDGVFFDPSFNWCKNLYQITIDLNDEIGNVIFHSSGSSIQTRNITGRFKKIFNVTNKTIKFNHGMTCNDIRKISKTCNLTKPIEAKRRFYATLKSEFKSTLRPKEILCFFSNDEFNKLKMIERSSLNLKSFTSVTTWILGMKGNVPKAFEHLFRTAFKELYLYDSVIRMGCLSFLDIFVPKGILFIQLKRGKLEGKDESFIEEDWENKLFQPIIQAAKKIGKPITGQIVITMDQIKRDDLVGFIELVIRMPFI